MEANKKSVTGQSKPALLNDSTTVEFNAEGHKVIVLITKRDLEANHPAVAQKVQALLDAGNRTWEEAAVFPDVIRNQQPQTKPFHFIDFPFKDGGPANPPLPAPPHVLAKMVDFTNVLKSGTGTTQEKTDALSWVFHLFGDVHQPLHCISHFSTLHPTGDRGGNSFLLKGKAKNLHSAWDSSVNVSEPGKGNDDLAVEIIALHSRASLHTELSEKDTEKWARASFSLAKKDAYSITENPTNPPKLSAAYLKKMEKIGRTQAALAAYRLADRLTEIFG
jgi:hypothetical protein